VEGSARGKKLEKVGEGGCVFSFSCFMGVFPGGGGRVMVGEDENGGVVDTSAFLGEGLKLMVGGDDNGGVVGRRGSPGVGTVPTGLRRAAPMT
jgi:hypothetical protein